MTSHGPEIQPELSDEALKETKKELEARLEALEARPKRNPVLHWIAFALALLSFFLLLLWVASPPGPVVNTWIQVDIGIAIFFAIEFFTRSGFRWHGLSYIRSRFFDFVAIIPALALVNHGVALQELWVWLILIARGIRVVDRFLGDGFVTRNALALVDGFEEEITDRVLVRIIERLQADMNQTGLSHVVAKSFRNHKSSILKRIREASPVPVDGFVPDVARLVGLDALLERVEDRTFEAVVGIIDSEEIDKAVREAVTSSFKNVLAEVGKRRWTEHLGIKH